MDTKHIIKVITEIEADAQKLLSKAAGLRTETSPLLTGPQIKAVRGLRAGLREWMATHLGEAMVAFDLGPLIILETKKPRGQREVINNK